MSSISNLSPQEGEPPGQKEKSPESKDSSLTEVFKQYVPRLPEASSWNRFGYPFSRESIVTTMRKLRDPSERLACMKYCSSTLGRELLSVLEEGWVTPPEELWKILDTALYSFNCIFWPLSPYVQLFFEHPPENPDCTENYRHLASCYPLEMVKILENGAITQPRYLAEAVSCFQYTSLRGDQITHILPKVLPYLPPSNRVQLLQHCLSVDTRATFSILNPRPLEDGFETCCGKMERREMDELLARTNPDGLLLYVSSHPELEESLAISLKRDTERLLTFASYLWSKGYPLTPLNVALTSPTFIRTFLKIHSIEECLASCFTFKLIEGFSHLFHSPPWLALSPEEKRGVVRNLPLEDLPAFEDDELLSLLEAWDPATREELMNRVALLNPEVCSRTSYCSKAEFHDLQRALEASSSHISPSSSRALTKGHSAVYGSQALYHEAFALGKAQAMWGIKHKKNWADILLALGIRRRRLALIQNTKEAPLFGLLRKSAAITSIEGHYANYREKAKACVRTPPCHQMVYRLGEKQHLLTQVTEKQWEHQAPAAKDLMNRFYELCDCVGDREKTPTEEEAVTTLAEAHWLFANMMPFERGSAMIMEMIFETLLDLRGISPRFPPQGESFDCEALTTHDIESYRAWYRNIVLSPSPRERATPGS